MCPEVWEDEASLQPQMGEEHAVPSMLAAHPWKFEPERRRAERGRGRHNTATSRRYYVKPGRRRLRRAIQRLSERAKAKGDDPLVGTRTDSQVAKMAALKAMRDAGSITEADFEARKVALLDAIAPLPSRREADR